MKRRVGDCILELVQGDITQQEVDAIVNAANTSLAPGAGVCGAIREAGGAEIFGECRQFYKRCATGEAVITGAGQLAARHIIHAVGPVYRDGYDGEAAQLTGAYRHSLRLAAENKVTSIAFPSLSTEIYGFPLDEAAPVALETVVEWLQTRAHELKLVRFVLCDEDTFEAYKQVLRTFNLREVHPAPLTLFDFV